MGNYRKWVECGFGVYDPIWFEADEYGNPKNQFEFERKLDQAYAYDTKKEMGTYHPHSFRAAYKKLRKEKSHTKIAYLFGVSREQLYRMMSDKKAKLMGVWPIEILKAMNAPMSHHPLVMCTPKQIFAATIYFEAWLNNQNHPHGQNLSLFNLG